MASALIVTGDIHLDRKLAELGPKIANKFSRKALRRGIKKVVDDTKKIVRAEAYNLGVIHKSFKVRALKRKRGRVGLAMFVDREKLFFDYAELYGHPPNPRKGEDDPHYYLASIEFGYERVDGTTVPAIRPMRRGLYENATEIQQFFVGDVREMLSEVDQK